MFKWNGMFERNLKIDVRITLRFRQAIRNAQDTWSEHLGVQYFSPSLSDGFSYHSSIFWEDSLSEEANLEAEIDYNSPKMLMYELTR